MIGLFVAWFAAAPVILVTVTPQMAVAPAEVTIGVQVVLDTTNEYAIVEVSGPKFFTVTTVRLHGSLATLPPMPLKKLTKGNYIVMAALYRTMPDTTAGEAGRAMGQFTVVGGK